jgi:hypothetical protein
MVQSSNFLTTQHTNWPTTTLMRVLLGVLPAPKSLSNYGSVQPCGSSVVYSECPPLILPFPSSNLIKIHNTSTMQTVSWHAEWLLSLSVWSCFNMIWIHVYISRKSLPLSLTQILNGIRKYLLIRPKTKKNFGKANIETATGNFLGGTL